jgi:hypothetical protein
LLLRDIAMQHLRLLLKVSFQEDLIGLLLGFAKNDGSAVPSTVKIYDI